MDFINIIGTLFDNSINHVVALAHQIKDLRLNKNQQDINEDLYEKIQEVDNSNRKSKGYYSSLQELNEAIPNPEVGDWAIITSEGQSLICRCNSAGIWTLSEEEYKEEIRLDQYPKKSEIKTLNGQSLIGTGNIQIQEGVNRLASDELDGLMSSESYTTLQNIKNTLIPGLEQSIQDLQKLVNSDESLSEIVEKFNAIKEFVENLDAEGEETLASIVNNIDTLSQSIERETQRARAEETSLKERVRVLESTPVTFVSNGVQHIILKKSQYNRLTEYEDNALYFVIKDWAFGEKFPIVLIDAWTFGKQFPINLK